MGESELCGLLGHGSANFGDAVTDADNGGLPAGIEKTAAILIDKPAAFTANGDRIRFAKISRKERGVGRHGDGNCSRRIVSGPEATIEYPSEKGLNNGAHPRKSVVGSVRK